MRASRPSSTALLIARCTLLAAREPAFQPLVPPDAVAPISALLAAAGGARWFTFAQRHAWTRRLLLAGERAILPGVIAHYLTRKAWIEQQVRAALAAGCEQVIVLGAGFDTLAWRLHRNHSHVQFFELDHPATQQPKTAALAPAANLTFLPCDLTHRLPSLTLHTHARFDAHRRTCVVAEGLLMYFPETRVKQILADLAQFPAVQIVFSFMAPGPDGRAEFRGGSRLINAWLRLRREPFAWAIPPQQVAPFLRPLSLETRLLAGAPELRAHVLSPLGLAATVLAEGEHLCLASNSAR